MKMRIYKPIEFQVTSTFDWKLRMFNLAFSEFGNALLASGGQVRDLSFKDPSHIK